MGETFNSNQNLEFQKNIFSEYYSKNKIALPDRFGKREFAFVFFGGKGMYRHLSFDKKISFNNFLKQKTPAHAYYSSAYYQIPHAQTMAEKNWMGAELIFDLDSDHLPNAKELTYEQQLEQVKKEFIKLVNDFLIDDFGFDERYIDLYFSGGRGYHCHVRDPKVLQLDSNERREIVDYITGRDIDDSLIFQEHATIRKNYGRVTYAGIKTLKMPSPEEPGWKGRISQGIIDIIEEIKNSDNPMEKLREYGVKPNDAEKLLEDLSDPRIDRIKQGNIDQSKTIRRFFLNNALRRTAVSMVAGETDEPVTCDVKRLIRLPGSLHGKTGFKVVETKLDDLVNFNPLNDAVVLSENLVNVEMQKDLTMKIRNNTFKLKEGIEKVPTYLAIYLIGIKIANIV